MSLKEVQKASANQRPGRPYWMSDRHKNTNLVEDVEFLLSVKFRQNLFSCFKGQGRRKQFQIEGAPKVQTANRKYKSIFHYKVKVQNFKKCMTFNPYHPNTHIHTHVAIKEMCLLNNVPLGNILQKDICTKSHYQGHKLARRGGVKVAGWTLDRKTRVRFPAYPHRVWALWWKGG